MQFLEGGGGGGHLPQMPHPGSATAGRGIQVPLLAIANEFIRIHMFTRVHVFTTFIPGALNAS